MNKSEEEVNEAMLERVIPRLPVISSYLTMYTMCSALYDMTSYYIHIV